MLTSPHHPLLKAVRRAASSGRATENGLVAAEGPHLLEEAVASKWTVEQIIATPDAQRRWSGLFQRSNADIITVSPRAFASISSTEHSQEITSLLRPRAWGWGDLAVLNAVIVVLDGVGDPGNAGTILRSAEAFGAAGAVFLSGSVHLENGKLLRAAAGSAFRIPILSEVHIMDALAAFREHGVRLYALDATDARTLHDVDFDGPCAVFVGSEGAGLSPEVRSAATSVSIPISRVESLNAAVACSVALYHVQTVRAIFSHSAGR